MNYYIANEAYNKTNVRLRSLNSAKEIVYDI